MTRKRKTLNAICHTVLIFMHHVFFFLILNPLSKSTAMSDHRRRNPSTFQQTLLI